MHYILMLGLLLVSLGAHAVRDVKFSSSGVPEAGYLVLPVLAEGVLTESGVAVNEKAGGAIAKAINEAEYEGAPGSIMTLRQLGPYSRIDLVGVGEDALSRVELENFGGSSAKAASQHSISADIHILIDGLNTEIEIAAAYVAFGFQLGEYSFDKHKQSSDKKKGALVIYTKTSELSSSAYNDDKSALAKSVMFARDLGSEPGNILYPEVFVERAKDAFRGVKNISIDVLNVKQMQRLNMGSLLGVGQGSVRPARLLVVRYQGRDSDANDFALVGKGITFDTGGISLKPNRGMWLMKSDMSGAAAVTATALALAKRQAPVNVVAIAGLAENMPSGNAIRPGDVLTSMAGKTVEIMSTDAEGRLVLIDAIHYALEQFKPEMLINIATLTGSAMRAVGDDYGALVTRDKEIRETLISAGEISGENVWPLPLHPSHYDQLDSLIADMKNTSDKPPGASTAAAFIGNFVPEDQPWAHLDIAGVDWRDESTPTTPVGHAGWGVRFLDQVIRQSLP